MTGACGQLGSELTCELAKNFGKQQVILSDISSPKTSFEGFTFVQLDVMDSVALKHIVEEHNISQIYHLAAMLSAKGESNPHQAWHLNMTGLLNVLEIARTKKLARIFWPSSIAVFGPSTPKVNTPQHTIMEPDTVYGISKLAGEQWCAYYFEKYGVDVRSLRYPGLIGYKSLPGGGTTDYAVDIYHKALAGKHFECFLAENTCLPMMYMSDAVKATIQLMQSSATSIRVRSAYNVSAMSFSATELVASIQKHLPKFTASYVPDFRQVIADSWPDSIDDSAARTDWDWQPEYSLETMTADMLKKLRD